MSKEPKRYDERYFHRWYHSRRAVPNPVDLGRRVRLAVAAAEFVLERPVRSVLDVGCGEGRWRAPLVRLRPRLAYLGIDPSDWAVRRYGRRRNLVRGDLADVGRLAGARTFDLVVCSDVAHFVPLADLKSGLELMHEHTRGVLWFDAFTSEDDFVGDRDEWQPRTASVYRRALERAGFTYLAPGCWIPGEPIERLAALERPIR